MIQITPYHVFAIFYFGLIAITGLIAMIRMTKRTDKFGLEESSYTVLGEPIPLSILAYATLMGILWPVFWILWAYVMVTKVRA